MFNKGFGYSLVAIGLLMILISVLSVYMVFTGSVDPISPFNTKGISLNLGSFLQGYGLPQTDLNQEIIDSSSLNQSLNFAAHLLLMGFIGSTGHKIANIGIYMTKEIKINLTQEKLKEVQNSTSRNS